MHHKVNDFGDVRIEEDNEQLDKTMDHIENTNSKMDMTQDEMLPKFID